MTKIQNSKPVLVIEYWNLIFFDTLRLRGQRKAGFFGSGFFTNKTLNNNVVRM